MKNKFEKEVDEPNSNKLYSSRVDDQTKKPVGR